MKTAFPACPFLPAILASFATAVGVPTEKIADSTGRLDALFQADI